MLRYLTRSAKSVGFIITVNVRIKVEELTNKHAQINVVSRAKNRLVRIIIMAENRANLTLWDFVPQYLTIL